MPVRAPAHRLYHRTWRTAHVANSPLGSVLARDAGDRWIDNDFHLSKDGIWINAHGAPELFWLPRHDRFENHLAADLFRRERNDGRRIYRLRNAVEALTDNHKHGLSTEFEVKDVRPWDTPEILDTLMAELAQVAAEVYGPDWQHHVIVKVLTNLGGGIPYALKVCRAAHHHDIPTMLLARGRARFMRFRNHPAVTYIRGSAVIR